MLPSADEGLSGGGCFLFAAVDRKSGRVPGRQRLRGIGANEARADDHRRDLARRFAVRVRERLMLNSLGEVVEHGDGVGVGAKPHTIIDHRGCAVG